jgi:ligand-binding SRPBCC domain-containing protein
MPVFETSVALNCSPRQAFEFLLRPANVARIAPPDIGLVFTKAPEILDLGSQFEFKVQAYGHIQTLLHEITELVPLEQITEVQIKGLFARWTHEHRFEQQGSDQVIVRDRIDFDPPAGMLGLLVTAGKILDQLDEGYHHRNLQLQKELGGST